MSNALSEPALAPIASVPAVAPAPSAMPPASADDPRVAALVASLEGVDIEDSLVDRQHGDLTTAARRGPVESQLAFGFAVHA